MGTQSARAPPALESWIPRRRPCQALPREMTAEQLFLIRAQSPMPQSQTANAKFTVIGRMSTSAKSSTVKLVSKVEENTPKYYTG